jgi:cytoskeleton protein RodZ
MESVGTRLRQARESRGYTVEQIARDTHIAKRFLEALETEDYDVIPGQPYLLGFLRTYSEYLGLEPEETVSLYHNMQLQEQPPPIDELISTRPKLPTLRVLGIGAAVIAAALVIYLLISSGILAGDDSQGTPPRAQTPEVTLTGERIEMDDEIIEQRFAQGDTVVVPVRDERIAVSISEVGDPLEISWAGRTSVVPQGQEVSLDLDGDERSDLRVLVRSLDPDGDPPSVVMRWDRGSGPSAQLATPEAPERSDDTPSVGSTSAPSREASARVIAEFNEPEEFVVQVRFEGYTLFRYELDQEPRVEQYFQQGDNLRISVQQQLKLWASNAASVRMRVAGRDLTLGEPGEVTSALVAWVDDAESDNTLLELIPVY